MWRLFIFLVLVMFKVEARLPDNDSVNVRIDVTPGFGCTLKNSYTFTEGQNVNLFVKTTRYINRGWWRVINGADSRNISSEIYSLMGTNRQENYNREDGPPEPIRHRHVVDKSMEGKWEFIFYLLKDNEYAYQANPNARAIYYNENGIIHTYLESTCSTNVKIDPLNFKEITFTIESMKDEDNVVNYICDHNDTNKQIHKYTVLEGEKFNIITKHNYYINHLIFRDYTKNQRFYNYKHSHLKNVTTFIAEKNMGTLWNCTVLTGRDTLIVQPVVRYDDGHYYSAAYCFVQIHVRQTNPPQTILVNNMTLEAVRTDLSEQDVDFTAEYQYADGDVVNVACVNFLGTASLTMEYRMADTLSDKFNSTNLSSNQAIGFSTKLHSGHNNSYLICTNTDKIDYTKVMVRFVMRTEFKCLVDGFVMRWFTPCIIEYKYLSNLPIKVVCEVERADVELVVSDSRSGFVGEVNSYRKTELIPSKQSEMSFHLNGEDKTLVCGSDYLEGGGSAELVRIRFSKGNFPIDQHPLHMELPPSGTVMELYDYSNDRSQKVIFYEFEDDERLQFKCGPLHSPQPGPVSYIQFKDSICKDNGCYVTQNVIVTDQHDNSEIVCRLMEQNDIIPSKEDKVLKEIRVMFRNRFPTATTTTTTTTLVQLTDHACANKIDSLKIQILEEELKYQQQIHKEELMFKLKTHKEDLMFKLKEREFKEKMWDMELKKKENEF